MDARGARLGWDPTAKPPRMRTAAKREHSYQQQPLGRSPGLANEFDLPTRDGKPRYTATLVGITAPWARAPGDLGTDAAT
jgi:hypothetical protein